MSDRLTPDIVPDLWMPTDPHLSPDGRRLAWAAAPYGRKDEHPEQSLWVADLDDSSPGRRWTRGHEDTSPRWSPDGTRLAFLSDRAERGTHGLHVLGAEGGEARPLAERKRSVAAPAWSPDGRQIAFLAPDEPTEEDERRKEERDDAEVYGEWRELTRLWVVDADGGEPQQVWAPDLQLGALAWSPDGRRLAVIATDGPLVEHRETTSVWVVDRDGQEARSLGVLPHAGDLGWSGDDTVVVTGPHEPEPQSGATVWALSADGGARRVVGTVVDEPRCTIGVAHAADGTRTLGVVAEGLDTRLEWLDPATGDREVALDVSGEVLGLAVAGAASEDDVKGRVIAVVVAGEELVPRVLVGRSRWLRALRALRDGRRAPSSGQASATGPDALRPVSDHGAGVAGLPVARPEPLTTSADDGTALDAVVLRPVGGGEGPWPTAVLVHGGPYGRSGLWSHAHPLDWGQLLAHHGYAVVMPNYRGGLGRGHAFATSVRGDMGGAEWRDVLSVVDAAVAAGIADPERLGIGGWSQGGFLTAWAVTATDRFRVGVMGAGVSDWGMMAATSDMPAFEAALGGSCPWDGAGPHRAAQGSPISFADRRRTPLLILHGADDQRVPLGQAVAFHRALAGQDVPVARVTYPREPHGLLERAHQVDAQRRVLEWFDRFVR